MSTHAHTDGDSLIYWTRANVLHMGDTYFNGMLPFIDLDSGGSIDGAIAAVETGLAHRQRARRVIIPGHGPLARRADLVRYRDMLVDLRRPGRRRASRPAARSTRSRRCASPTATAAPNDFITPDSLIETIYRSLTSPRTLGQHSTVQLVAEHPREDRVDMLEMIVEVELRLDLGR